MKKILDFFDKLEDKIRKWLSRHPIIYAFIGGAGVVIFWRGVWHTVDFLVDAYTSSTVLNQSINGGKIWWDGPVSLVLGTVILLLT
jgi:hypothetical protein